MVKEKTILLRSLPLRFNQLPVLFPQPDTSLKITPFALKSFLAYFVSVLKLKILFTPVISLNQSSIFILINLDKKAMFLNLISDLKFLFKETPYQSLSLFC